MVVARYGTISLRLHPSDAEEGVYREWQAQVGLIEGWHSAGFVLLGSMGFLDHFTVGGCRVAHPRPRVAAGEDLIANAVVVDLRAPAG